MKTKTPIRKRFNHLIYIGAFLVVAACSDSESPLLPPDPADGQPVEFRIAPPPAFVDAATGTRVAIDGAGKLVWKDDDVLLVKMTYGPESDQRTRNGTLTYNGGAWTADNNLRWPAEYTGTITFNAYYDNRRHGAAAAMYTATVTGTSTDPDPMELNFSPKVRQFIFRGIKAGQMLTLGGDKWCGVGIVPEILPEGPNANYPNYEQYSINGETELDFLGNGDDIVLYLVMPDGVSHNAKYPYSIGGKLMGDLIDLQASGADGDRHIIHCGSGGTSADPSTW